MAVKLRDEVLIYLAFPQGDPRATMNGRREANVTRKPKPDNDLAPDECDVGVLAKVNVAEEDQRPQYERQLLGGFTRAKQAQTAADCRTHGTYWTLDQQAEFFPEGA